jgi:ParB family chromosome partitioning protein
MPTTPASKSKTTTRRRRKAAPRSRGRAAQRLTGEPPEDLETLADAIENDGGSIIGTYRDPLGGNWQLFAGLPIDVVQPTPFQRDLSDAHVGKLANAVDKLDRFLDPIVVVRSGDGLYWTPNGHHRLAAMRKLGAKSIVALLVPEEEIAYRILALNTEKAHNLRERSLEVIRMAHELSMLYPRPEKEFEAEFEEAPLLTLGVCYQTNPRFAGSAFHPVLKRIDRFLSERLPQALEIREARAARVTELGAAVAQVVDGLRARGFESPYLRNFVIARINPLRFRRGATAEFDPTIDKMLDAAERFDTSKIRPDQLARASGPPG